jgi:membrane protease subunit (stomatin/prohibitin family)
LPFLGVLIYLIAHGKEMGQRDIEQAQANKAQFDDYVRSVSASDGGAAKIAQAKSLLDSGAITQAEFEAIKSRALAAA